NRPAIEIAADKLWVSDMELILEKGADINATCDQGSTALIQYARLRYTEGLEMLISRGADIHISSQKWGTALHAAASRGFTEGCKLLQEAGADVNQVAGDFGTALQAACSGGHEDNVQQLLYYGADVNLQPANGKYGYPLHAAANACETAILDKLLDEYGANVHLEGGMYGFALIAAAAGEWPKSAYNTALSLLDHGADVSAIASDGIFISAIAAAAFENNNDLLKLLIERGGDVHQAGGKYGSPLICATIKTPKEADETDDDDTTSDNCFDTLLLHGVDVNYRSSGRYHTALIAAAYFDRHDYVLKLLDRGADIRISCDGPYRSAIAAAAIKGNQKILEKFLEMNPPNQLLDDALVESCAHRQSTSVKSLLQKGANVYARHPQLGTPMDALNNSQPDAYNSDDESDDDSDDDSSDEDSDDEDVDWEGDGKSIAESDAESVSDVPDEEGDSEEIKIRKLLEEMMQRVKRNPTIKRF
ncbi:ankyrin, partial [Periconia macrospinosa]